MILSHRLDHESTASIQDESLQTTSKRDDEAAVLPIAVIKHSIINHRLSPSTKWAQSSSTRRPELSVFIPLQVF